MRLRSAMRVGSLLFTASAMSVWLAWPAAAATTEGPTKTAWYDNTGAQSATGVATPSAAKSGELEVSYVPVSVQEPQETLPPAPSIPGAPVSPPSGRAGGTTAGGTLAFSAVEYSVPLRDQGQTIDPSTIHATLTLQLDSSSSAGVSSGDLVACPTATPLWTAGPDQDTSAAPQYSCATGQAVTGNVSGTTVTFALGPQQESSLEPGVFSEVVVPGSSPSGAFQAVIEPPAADSLDLTNEAPTTNSNLNVAASGTSASEAVSPGSSGDYAITPYSAASSPVPAFGGPSTAASGSSPASSAKSGESGARALRPSAPASTGFSAATQRTVAVSLLLALAVLLALGSSREVREPRSLRALVAGRA